MLRHLTAGFVALLVASCASSTTINVWPGIAPGSEDWQQQETTVADTPIGAVTLNVVTPTLTAYLPNRGRAARTGVIIAPGGAFVALAVELEGHKVARWLQQHGIAAFVLKYRTVEKRQEGIPTLDMDEAGKFAIADAVQALKIVRQNATNWNVSPDRIGIIGFSAGAMVASGTLLQADAAARPSFTALIYGAPFGAMPSIPRDLPPIFMAWAQDDAVALGPIVRFHKALEAAGHKPEVHIFASGGHGFGMKQQGMSSDHWIDAFQFWLETQRS